MPNRYDFTGRKAVVTGGARGIGRAVVEGLVASGGEVAIWDRDRERAERTAAELGVGVEAFEVDITDYAAGEAARDRTLAAFGIEPTPMNAILPTYLWRFRRNGQFDRPATA